MIFVVDLAERETRGQHLLAFCGTEIDGFVRIFFEDGAIAEPAYFEIWLSNYRLIQPIAILDPLNHDNHFFACNFLISCHFVLFE